MSRCRLRRLGVVRDALAEGVALVVVRSPLVVERLRAHVLALLLAGLGGVDRRLLLLLRLRLGRLRDALAEGVGLVGVRAVLELERGLTLGLLGLARRRSIGLVLRLLLHLLRDALA